MHGLLRNCKTCFLVHVGKIGRAPGINVDTLQLCHVLLHPVSSISDYEVWGCMMLRACNFFLTPDQGHDKHDSRIHMIQYYIHAVLYLHDFSLLET